ncbi:MAG: rhodanese-like domain-containing protein [Arenimonas sp.]|nr:rhodanese-like domain-containing protein [Arenimonas sp.]
MKPYALMFSLSALLSAPLAAVELPGPVVSPEWLDQNRDAVVVLDVRNGLDAFTEAPEYETAEDGSKKLTVVGGHVPGARPVDFNTLRISTTVDGKKIDKMLPSREQVQALVRGWGVNQGDVLVITSPGESFDESDMAARLYWTLKVHGHEAMALLDGGNAAWGQAGLPLATDAATAPAAGNWTAGELRGQWLAAAADLKPGQASPQLVDARPAPQYLGLFFKKPAVTAGGHVEGAVNFAPDVRTREAGLARGFFTADRYRQVLGAVGVKPEAGSIVYCNTGHMAAGAWFVLSEVLGVENVKLYDGSMHEWTTLGHPVVGLD